MNWFRMFSEARNDAKLRSLTADQFRVWFRLLCYSSEQERRGTIAGRTMKVLALEAADGDEVLFAETCGALAELGMIEFDVTAAPCARIAFKSFERRQFFNRSDDKDSARMRAAKSRSKRRTIDVTAGHGGSRRVTAGHGLRTDTDTDTEEKTPVPPPLAIVQPPEAAASPDPPGESHPDPDLEPFHSPPVVVSQDSPPIRSGRDLADWDAAVALLRKNRETAPLAGAMEMYADDGRIAGLEGWRFIQGARVVGQPGKSANWRFFLGCVRNATRQEFDAWTARESRPDPGDDYESRRLPPSPPDSPMWKLYRQVNACANS